MKKKSILIALCLLVAFCIGSEGIALAQEGTTLQMQGLNYITNQSAVSRAAGGTTLGLLNNPSIMFLNPAMLSTVDGIQISVGGYQQFLRQTQDQRYGTLQGHAGAVFLLQGITDQIPDPDYSTITRRLTQEDSVQRPFDNLGPTWSRTKDVTLPLQLFVSVPVKIGSMKMTIGAGAVEYANLNWFYQNNNTLSPNILDVTNGTYRTNNLPRNDTVVTVNQPLPVQWYQYKQYRDGSIYGYGGAVSLEISPKLSLGLSGMYLDGSTDDFESHVGRGRMLFFYNSIRLDKFGMTNWNKKGESNYSGYEFNLSGLYKAKYVTIGFSIKPPTTIEREFSYTYSRDSITATSLLNGKVDSLHEVTSGTINGKDKMELPFRGSVGISINVKQNLVVSFEYELLPYESADYVAIDGSKSNPWLSYSLMRFGIEYGATDWLKLRGGVHESGEVFQPATNALRGDNVKYPVYSLGCGIKIFKATVNLAYEYADRRYTDVWSNSASINHQYVHNIVAELVYQLPSF